MPDFDLTTQDGIRTAGGRVLGLRSDVADGRALTLDEQRELLDIAYAALLLLRPAPPPLRMVDADDGRTIPAWLRDQQEDFDARC
jgi:hypothetical protein